MYKDKWLRICIKINESEAVSCCWCFRCHACMCACVYVCIKINNSEEIRCNWRSKCIHVCVHVCMCIQTHVVRVYWSKEDRQTVTAAHVCMCICTYVWMYVSRRYSRTLSYDCHMRVCMHICVYMYVCMNMRFTSRLLNLLLELLGTYVRRYVCICDNVCMFESMKQKCAACTDIRYQTRILGKNT